MKIYGDIPGVPVGALFQNTATAGRVKEYHDFRCHVCGERLLTPVGPYAETAHIRPLGAPHNGPDTEDNILCLCPNHHVLFDLGAITVGDDLTFRGLGQPADGAPPQVSPGQLRYHRQLYGRTEAV